MTLDLHNLFFFTGTFSQSIARRARNARYLTRESPPRDIFIKLHITDFQARQWTFALHSIDYTLRYYSLRRIIIKLIVPLDVNSAGFAVRMFRGGYAPAPAAIFLPASG